MKTFYIVSTIIALSLNASLNFILPIAYKKGLKKKGKVFRNSDSIKGIIAGFLVDFIPFLNVIPIVVNVFVIGCFIKFKDKMLNSYSDAYSAEIVKRKYENDESDEKDIKDTLTLEGLNKEEIKSEMEKVKNYYCSSNKKSSYQVTPVFTKKEYDWAITYLDAKNFVDSLITEVTLDDKTKYEIISDLIDYAKTIDDEDYVIKPSKKETNNYVEEERDETVSDAVLGIINKHLELTKKY